MYIYNGKTKLGKMIKNAQTKLSKSNFNFINNKYLLYYIINCYI